METKRKAFAEQAGIYGIVHAFQRLRIQNPALSPQSTQEVCSKTPTQTPTTLIQTPAPNLPSLPHSRSKNILLLRLRLWIRFRFSFGLSLPRINLRKHLIKQRLAREQRRDRLADLRPPLESLADLVLVLADELGGALGGVTHVVLGFVQEAAEARLCLGIGVGFRVRFRFRFAPIQGVEQLVVVEQAGVAREKERRGEFAYLDGGREAFADLVVYC